MKKVLYSVLNWGLGHASRSTPIIEYLIQCKYEVYIASDGIALEFLKQRFPSCKFKELPSYDIKYAKNKNLSWKLLLHLPHIASTIKKEQSVIEILHKEEIFDLVISDNRFGSSLNDIPSVYITHQVNIISPFGKSFLKRLHGNIINKYDECWIPDYEGKQNLAGELSQNSKHLKKAIYIGKLSHLSISNEEKKFDIAYILSGPEPQRSILEKKILNQHPIDLKGVIVRGTNNGSELPKTDKLKVFDLLDSKELEFVLSRSSRVLCRTGYTSIMDLCQTQIPVLMIPTPGQTEQEYLGNILDNMFGNIMEQDKYLFNKDSFKPIELNLPENQISFKDRIKSLLQ